METKKDGGRTTSIGSKDRMMMIDANLKCPTKTVLKQKKKGAKSFSGKMLKQKLNSVSSQQGMGAYFKKLSGIDCVLPWEFQDSLKREGSKNSSSVHVCTDFRKDSEEGK